MKILLFAVLFILALGQSIPPSTNPAGQSYFSPLVVQSLSAGQETSSSISYDKTTYQEFYQVWIPPSVGTIRITLNNTTPKLSSYNYLTAQINTIGKNGFEDETVGFSCYPMSTGWPVCDESDMNLRVYTGEYDWIDLRAGTDFLPGSWIYLTIYKEWESSESVDYSLKVEATFSCAQGTTVGRGSTLTCVSNSDITLVSTNEASYNGYLSESEEDYYRVNVPQNVSRLWIWVTSESYYLDVSAAMGYVPVWSFYAFPYTAAKFNSTTNSYHYYLEIQLPRFDTPFYFAVTPTQGSVNYNISFLWNACGANTAGLGVMDNDYNTASTSFTIPDCSFPVVAPHIDATSLETIKFNLPAYTGEIPSAAYGFMHVPNGTVGNRNFTCASNSSNTWVVFNKEETVQCNQDIWKIHCNSNNDYFWLLSEDLHPGGDWSIAACSTDSTATTTVSLVSNSQPTDSSSDGQLTTPGMHTLLVAGFLVIRFHHFG